MGCPSADRSEALDRRRRHGNLQLENTETRNMMFWFTLAGFSLLLLLFVSVT